MAASRGGEEGSAEEGKGEGARRGQRGGAERGAAARVSTEQVANRAALSQAEAAAVNNAQRLSMIFLNTAETAKVFADHLRLSGVDCVEYHKLCRAAERESNLRKFRDGQVKVLVCTDSAARGLDLPQVRLVVQAEFALNVVQHQHRVGRASRGGRAGCAINLVFPDSRSLVISLLQHQNQLIGWEEEKNDAADARDTQDRSSVVPAAENALDGRSAGIEHAFSRRRGFRRSLKRQHSRNLSEDGGPLA